LARQKFTAVKSFDELRELAGGEDAAALGSGAPAQPPARIGKGALLGCALDISNGIANQSFEEILPDIEAGVFRNSMLVTLALSGNANAQDVLFEHKAKFDRNLWMIAAARSAMLYGENAGRLRAECEHEISDAWKRDWEEGAFAAISAGLILAGKESRGLDALARSFAQWRNSRMDRCGLLVEWLDAEAKDLMDPEEGEVDAKKLELIGAVFNFIRKGVKIDNEMRNEQARNSIELEIKRRLEPVHRILEDMNAVPPEFDAVAGGIAKECIARNTGLKYHVTQVLAPELEEEMACAFGFRLGQVVKIAKMAAICRKAPGATAFFNNVIDSNAPPSSQRFAKMFLAYLAGENRATLAKGPGGAAEARFVNGPGAGTQFQAKKKPLVQ